MFGSPGRTRYLSISHTNVFRIKIPPAPGKQRKDPRALIKARLPEQGCTCGAAGLTVCPAQPAEPPREHQDMPPHLGASNFLVVSPGLCNKRQGKARQPWDGVAGPHISLEVCPGQLAHVNSSAVAPSDGLAHNTEKQLFLAA